MLLFVNVFLLNLDFQLKSIVSFSLFLNEIVNQVFVNKNIDLEYKEGIYLTKGHRQEKMSATTVAHKDS